MHVQVESLRSILKLCFCIEGDPVPAIEGGGYRLLFRASCYDIEEKQEVDTYLENLNDHFRDLKTEASNTGNYRDSTRIDELVKLIRAVTKEIIKRARKIQIKNAVCTECYQKIPLCTLDEGNIQILCDTCTPEPTNEYKSQSLIDYKDNDIPRTD